MKKQSVTMLELYRRLGVVVDEPTYGYPVYAERTAGQGRIFSLILEEQSYNDPVPEDVFQLLQSQVLTGPEEWLNEAWLGRDMGDVRRAYYELRGNRVTREQAYEICQCTNWQCPQDKNYIWLPAVATVYLSGNHLPDNYGIFQLNGNFGHNGIMGVYESTMSLIEGFLNLLRRFHFLEFAIAVTSWDELTEKRWRDLENHIDAYSFHYPISEEDVDFGLLCKDGKIELLTPSEAVAAVRQYEAQYSEEERKMFDPDWSEGYYAGPGQAELADYLRWCRERGLKAGDGHLPRKRNTESSDRPVRALRKFPRCYPDVGPGWWPILDESMDLIFDADPDCTLDIREKYGTLRITPVSSDNALELQLYCDEGENRSESVCELCGRPGRFREDRPWMKTLCDSCDALSPQDYMAASRKAVTQAGVCWLCGGPVRDRTKGRPWLMSICSDCASIEEDHQFLQKIKASIHWTGSIEQVDHLSTAMAERRLWLGK